YKDITEHKKIAEKILFLNYHDVLTGLYNRRFYEKEIIRMDTEDNLPISIIMGDVNGLKLINDAFGHDKGDELLQKAANSIQNACRSEEIIARYGGDEFVILLPKTEIEAAHEIISRIKEIFANELVNTIRGSISFGCDSKIIAGDNIFKTLKNAEDNMYKNKTHESKSNRGNTINTIISILNKKSPREESNAKEVSAVCQSIGRALGLSPTKITKLKMAGLLHDIGTIAIEQRVLNNPGKLTKKQWSEVKRHSDIGYRILISSPEMIDLAEFIRAHHERWDGKGYPVGLKSEKIPLEARIIALADSYVAMTSPRLYKSVLSKAEAIEEIQKNAGIQFDAEIAKVFVEKVLGEKWIELV
ncbi:MAG: diguanylate cyclase, partial [Vallitaleaceae bacterium]|nr:diguanylate cyclase [Vallitaleaceae bacterium]